jgi:hypothetical protein
VRVIEVARGASAGDGAAARAAREGAFVEPTVREPPNLRVNPVLKRGPVVDDEPVLHPRIDAVDERAFEVGGRLSAALGESDLRSGPHAPAATTRERAAPRHAPSGRSRADLVVVLLFAYSVAALAVAIVLLLS